jgi:hypothetical protein
MMLRGGAQDRRISPQLGLGMNCHCAPQRRPYSYDPYSILTDLEFTTKPSVFNELI